MRPGSNLWDFATSLLSPWGAVSHPYFWSPIWTQRLSCDPLWEIWYQQDPSPGPYPACFEVITLCLIFSLCLLLSWFWSLHFCQWLVWAWLSLLTRFSNSWLSEDSVVGLEVNLDEVLAFYFHILTITATMPVLLAVHPRRWVGWLDVVWLLACFQSDICQIRIWGAPWRRPS